MTKKFFFYSVLIVFFVGGLSGIIWSRFLIPYVANATGWQPLNKLITTAPIVVNRTTQVQLNDGANLQDLINQAGNITVGIYDQPGNFLGNGFIVTSDGLILTAKNILPKSGDITVVTADGRKYPATVKAKDTKESFAIVSVMASGLVTTQFDQAANLQPGQKVVYLGRSNAKFQHMAVTGYITQSLDNEPTDKKISSDANLSADYAGGPILNLQGHIVGLNVDGSQNIISETLQSALSAYLNTK